MTSETPLTNAFMATQRVAFSDGSDTGMLLMNFGPIQDFARQLERDRAALIAATETANTELTTLLPRLSGQYAINVRELISHLRATLAQVRS